MRTLEQANPMVQFLYICMVAGITMFTDDAVFAGISLICALSAAGVFRAAGKRTHFFSLMMFLGIAGINPLLNHRGDTILFVLNDSPITLEAIRYGAVLGMLVAAMLYWFHCLTAMMTADRVMYVLGSASPKLCLLFSMALRFVPLFAEKRRSVAEAQTAMGLYQEDGIADYVKGHLRIFSVMVTWALENGIITADSMAARGYGMGKRSSCSPHRFRKCDGILLALFTVLFLAGIFLQGAYGAAAFALLGFSPAILHLMEEGKWRYLQSKI